MQNRNRLTDFEKFMVTKGDRLLGRDRLGVWDGNAVKLGCDDGCTTINIIKFTEFKINKKAAGQLFHSLKEKERLDNLWF